LAQRELSGSAAAQLSLQRLGVTGSVLMIAAHPDDENTALLAWLARGRKVRTGYLSLTRGEGGQNLIGVEQGDAMGVIRTQELLAARRIDGAEQFFTRAIDFGFTKTPQETLAKWGREKILSDVVWVIRKFRPDVIVLRFSGTPRDGHGQHQTSAILGKEAYFAAGDPSRFPEQLKYVQPWRAKRLLWNAFAFNDEQRKETAKIKDKLEVDPGEYDPLLGYSYREIAGMSRSMHRSQGMGAGQRPGTSKEFLTLVAGDPARKDMFDGIDLTWNRVEGGAIVGKLVAQALADYKPEHPENAIAPLLEARSRFAALHDPIADRKKKDLDNAIALCAGLSLDATANEFEYSPGEKMKVTFTAVDRGTVPVTLKSVSLEPGSTVAGGALEHNVPKSLSLEAAIPAGAPYSQPYWLREPKQGDTYTVPDQELIGTPENRPIYSAKFELAFPGGEIEVTRPVHYRWVDPQRGELTRPLAIVPPVALEFDGSALVFATPEPRTVQVRLKSVHRDENGTVRLQSPEGWKTEPGVLPFHFSQPGQETALEFRVTPPAGDSQGKLQAVASLDGREITSETQLINYPHIPPEFLFPPAHAKLVRADIRSLARSVGYIMGAGDRLPEALRQIGIDVTLLGPADLASGDLSRFDTIVTGVRAYNVRTDLKANQQRLLDYVKQGGTLVAQYNTLDSARFGGDERALDHIVGPYSIQFSHDRVTVEDAPVTFLDPASPLLREPNRISERDFDGWIQERGLYFAHEWDKRYQPLFSLHDPGEAPLKGGTLYTPYGKGMFVFTAFSWFRELPAGVPGAYRIFANLLSAGKTMTQAGSR
jgi:LmbE family N-acetylglucosaminyl deacetylase